MKGRYKDQFKIKKQVVRVTTTTKAIKVTVSLKTKPSEILAEALSPDFMEKVEETKKGNEISTQLVLLVFEDRPIRIPCNKPKLWREKLAQLHRNAEADAIGKAGEKLKKRMAKELV